MNELPGLSRTPQRITMMLASPVGILKEQSTGKKNNVKSHGFEISFSPEARDHQERLPPEEQAQPPHPQQTHSNSNDRCPCTGGERAKKYEGKVEDAYPRGVLWMEGYIQDHPKCTENLKNIQPKLAFTAS